MLNLIDRSVLFDSNIMQSIGSFTWWYVDLTDQEGNGLVLIWFVGLPFLPSKSLDLKPKNNSGVTVSLYKRHRLDFYAFQTYAPDQIHISEDQKEWRMGNSELKLVAEEGSLLLTAHLELPFAGSDTPFTGDLKIEGYLRNAAPSMGSHEHPKHVWCPMMLQGKGLFEGQANAEITTLTGSAYMDRNQSEESLPQLGIEDWHWCRLSFPEETWVFYFLKGIDGKWLQWAFCADADHNFTQVEVLKHEVKNIKRDRYGILWHQTHFFHVKSKPEPLQMELSPALERSPFYMRHMSNASLGAHQGQGIYERILPQKISQKWMQPLMAMRINEWHRNKSMWLALFEGPAKGKLKRLWNSWTHRKPTNKTVKALQ